MKFQNLDEVTNIQLNEAMLGRNTPYTPKLILGVITSTDNLDNIISGKI